MKKVEAIIQPDKVEDVKKALAGIGLKGLNVGKIDGFTRDTLRRQAVRSAEYDVDVVPMGMITTVVEDEVLERAVAAIKDAASTGRSRDGRIFVSEIAQAVNIRNGDTGVNAITRSPAAGRRDVA